MAVSQSDCMADIWLAYQATGFPEEVTSVLLASWSQSTKSVTGVLGGNGPIGVLPEPLLLFGCGHRCVDPLDGDSDKSVPRILNWRSFRLLSHMDICVRVRLSLEIFQLCRVL